MKNFLIAILGMVIIASCDRVDAGNVGIKFYLLGGSKGVDQEVLKPGRYWIGINEELYTFPTYTQNYVWTKDVTEGSETDESISFQTVEGMSVNVDVGITYHLEESKVPMIFQKYKKGINEITDVFLRNMVRDAFVSVSSNKPVESVYGNGKNKLLEEVQIMVKKQTDDIGIIVDKIYLVGDMRLPPQVLTALNKKIEATQRAQQRENELREAQAEAQKKIAEADGDAQSTLLKAKAEAEANKIVSQSLTPTLVEYEKIRKWDGALPQVDGSGGTIISLK